MSRQRVVLRCEGVHNGLAMVTVPQWQVGISFFIVPTTETLGVLEDGLQRQRSFFYADANIEAKMSSELKLDNFQVAGDEIDYRRFTLIQKQEMGQIEQPW